MLSFESDEAAEGTWVWQNSGNGLTDSYWQAGQPDNHLSNQDCGFFHVAVDYKWDDNFCSTLQYPIC